MIRRQPRSTRTDTLFPYTNALPIFQAAAVALLMATTAGLFVWASRTMGRNWSIVARTRADHRLVTTGPFAHVRHPIYGALFLFMLAIAIGLGPLPRLSGAIPPYSSGPSPGIMAADVLCPALLGPRFRAHS